MIKPGDTQNEAHFPPKFMCSAIGELKVRLAVYKHRGEAVILLATVLQCDPKQMPSVCGTSDCFMGKRE